MNSETGNNLVVFFLAVFISLLCTMTAFLTMKPEPELEESSIIIFQPPENAS